MANGIMPICNLCDRQFPTFEEYAAHLAKEHGIVARGTDKQMDLTARDNSEVVQLRAALDAKQSELAALTHELDVTVAENVELKGTIKSLEDEKATLVAELNELANAPKATKAAKAADAEAKK